MTFSKPVSQLNSVFSNRSANKRPLATSPNRPRTGLRLGRGSDIQTAALLSKRPSHPELRMLQWTRSTRNWELKDELWLNPEHTPRTELKQCA